MNKNLFIEKIPWLYHLTDSRNLALILQEKKLYSANYLIEHSNSEQKDALKKERRKEHHRIGIKDREVWIRDQRPLNAALDKCLSDGWTREQFIYHLNDRVFFWPNLDRLNIHFNRYKEEVPVLIKVASDMALELNPHAQLCHLNSGATRPLASLGGKAPTRGPHTFVDLVEFDRGVLAVAEVTFPNEFLLPNKFWISYNPNGDWRENALS